MAFSQDVLIIDPISYMYIYIISLNNLYILYLYSDRAGGLLGATEGLRASLPRCACAACPLASASPVAAHRAPLAAAPACSWRPLDPPTDQTEPLLT